MNNNISLKRISDNIDTNIAAMLYLFLIKSHIQYAENIGLDDQVSKNYTIEDAYKSILNKNRECYLIFKEDNIVGVLLNEIKDSELKSKCNYIHGLYIMERFRHQNIETKALSLLQNKTGIKIIELCCYYKLSAHSFYQKNGFVPLYTKYIKL